MDITERKRIAKIVLCIMLLFFSAGSAWATQSVAASCQYDPVFGGLRIGNTTLYAPYQFFKWSNIYAKAMPHIIGEAERKLYLTVIAGAVLSVLVVKGRRRLSSHGTADWAERKDIVSAGLDTTHGVILGINPYTKKLLRHDGAEHLLLMAPTRSGKGVNTIITTCLTWLHSIFVTDVKGENWHFTAGYRKHVLKQKVIKFEPLNDDGSSARWNPLAEIHFRTSDEISDIQNLVTMVVDPEGKGQLDYWATTGSALLLGVTTHLLYAHQRENRALPTMSNIATFLSSPERDFDEQLDIMKSYPHISPEEFWSEDNILQKIYGEYITNFTPFTEELGVEVQSMNELKQAMQGRNIDFTDTEKPFHILLTHPKVAEAAAEMQNKAPNEKSGVLSTAKSFLNLYQNPVVAKNTSISEFQIEDLLTPEHNVSFFLVIPPRDLETLRPLVRLLLNFVLRSLIKKMEFEDEKTKASKKQRLLLLLDEFPQFGRLNTMETALAVMAGYGIKACVITQDINQLNKAYTKDNSIVSNCHVRIFFTPNDDNTPQIISKTLGKKTIFVESNSTQGGLMKGSTSTSEIGRDLLTPDEVSKLDKDKSLILVAGYKPILATKLRYWQEPYFQRRIMPPPLISDKCTVIDSYESFLKVHEQDALNAAERAAKVQEVKRQMESVHNEHNEGDQP
ncbi:type IV secretory system conjugative DNA transfer family protein [Anaerospora hongkongensis]|uniref:type IV secretory system conjugative DNA transfer family protein n=1 Tax=Anaerospora hongkongensis TaxID=244830 RepID=UPI002FDA26A5